MISFPKRYQNLLGILQTLKCRRKWRVELCLPPPHTCAYTTTEDSHTTHNTLTHTATFTHCSYLMSCSSPPPARALKACGVKEGPSVFQSSAFIPQYLQIVSKRREAHDAGARLVVVVFWQDTVCAFNVHQQSRDLRSGQGGETLFFQGAAKLVLPTFRCVDLGFIKMY